MALVSGRDLTDPQMTATQLIGSVEYALPAIEIVDSPIAAGTRVSSTRSPTTHRRVDVLETQPVKLTDIDLRLAGMVMECAGQPVSRRWSCVPGDPLHAVLRAARTLARVGIPLTAGEVVSRATLGPAAGSNTIPPTGLRPPCRGWEASRSASGSVRESLSDCVGNAVAAGGC